MACTESAFWCCVSSITSLYPTLKLFVWALHAQFLLGLHCELSVLVLSSCTVGGTCISHVSHKPYAQHLKPLTHKCSDPNDQYNMKFRSVPMLRCGWFDLVTSCLPGNCAMRRRASTAKYRFRACTCLHSLCTQIVRSLFSSSWLQLLSVCHWILHKSDLTRKMLVLALHLST